MDYEFLHSFTPRILDVVEREQRYWQHFNYVLEREKTRVHTLAYVHRGKGTLEIGGQRYTLSPGCIFQVWPDEYMRITTQRAGTVCFYSVHFKYGLIRWEGADMLWQDTVLKLPFPIVQPRPVNPVLLEEFERAYMLWSEKNSGYQWYVKIRFFNMLQQLSALESFDREETPAAVAAVQNAIDYMKTHYSRNLSRDDLASHVSLSPGYFTITFKKHTGLSPVQYLNKIRLDRAKRLLKSTTLPVKEIAEDVGFADSFYFTRLFSKEVGMSPREYRNS